MSKPPIDYYFTISSPWSYIGHRKFLDLAAAAGREVAFNPVDFGTIFPQSGGLPLPKRSEQRRRYRMFELQRWRDYRELELNLRPKFFPADATLGAAMLIAADEAGQDVGRLTEGFMRACWVEEQNIADRATLVAIADGFGMDGNALADAAQSDAGQAKAKALTETAIQAHVFGAPTYVVDGEPFWGQDRLELVERALNGIAGPYKVEGPV